MRLRQGPLIIQSFVLRDSVDLLRHGRFWPVHGADDPTRDTPLRQPVQGLETDEAMGFKLDQVDFAPTVLVQASLLLPTAQRIDGQPS